MYKIWTSMYENLPDWVDRDSLSGNGAGPEYAEYLLINDSTKRVYSDAMEAEDTRFCRDLRWIIKELNNAYKVGMKDGGIEELRKVPDSHRYVNERLKELRG